MGISADSKVLILGAALFTDSPAETDMLTVGRLPTAATAEKNLRTERMTTMNNIKFVWNGIKINGEFFKCSYGTGPYTAASVPKAPLTS